MALLNILTYPEKSLSQPSEPVEIIDNDLQNLIKDMGETMFHYCGIGLAAPQVGINQRIIIYNYSNAHDDINQNQEYTALINPEIISTTKETFISENEGCLSVPNYRSDVKRYRQVTVNALDIESKIIKIHADGLLAIIMQHEIDHLNGILFIDRISLLKRAMYKKNFLKNRIK